MGAGKIRSQWVDGKKPDTGTQNRDFTSIKGKNTKGMFNVHDYTTTNNANTERISTKDEKATQKEIHKRRKARMLRTSLMLETLENTLSCIVIFSYHAAFCFLFRFYATFYLVDYCSVVNLP